MNRLERKIFELTFDVSWQDLPKELKKLGLEVVELDGVLNVKNQEMGSGLMESLDPSSKATQLAFALCGSQWPHFLPDLLESVAKEWKRRKKEGR